MTPRERALVDHMAVKLDRDFDADAFERYVLTEYADVALVTRHPDGVTLLIRIYRTGDAAERHALAKMTGFNQADVLGGGR